MHIRLTILILILSSCGRVPVRSDVGASITRAIAANSPVIDLGTLADFGWDEVCVLGPFMRPADISAKLGVEWKGKRSGGRGSLVFLDVKTPRADSSVTGHLPLRGATWFVQAAGCIPRSQARFTIQRADGRTATLVPIGSTPAAHENTPFNQRPN